MNSSSNLVICISWLCRLTTATILVQTLFFKFIAAPKSVSLLNNAGLGATGRIGSGIIDLSAAILLLIPSTTWLGAVVALGLTAVAIISHLRVLSPFALGDCGELFGLACTVAPCSLILIFIHRRDMPLIGKSFTR